MSIGLTSIKSWLASRKQQNTQSSNVVGDNNSVEQNINIYVAIGEDLQKSLNSDAALLEGSDWQMAIKADTIAGDDSEEFKLISKFREVANGGDSTTALKLLEGLKAEKRFSDGFAAFRLSFNIGIILQNIGEYEKASWTCHSFVPVPCSVFMQLFVQKPVGFSNLMLSGDELDCKTH
jgi:hypothetical protein